MPRNHFSKTMFSPYFQSEHYKETEAWKNEEKIYNFFAKIKNKIFRKK